VAASQFTAPATVTIAAEAADADGSVARVEFYADDRFIGSSTTAPFAATWPVRGPGTASLTARAIDHRGASTTSPPVSIVINPATLQPGNEVVLHAAHAPIARAGTSPPTPPPQAAIDCRIPTRVLPN
jgi:hypothetical protein